MGGVNEDPALITTSTHAQSNLISEPPNLVFFMKSHQKRVSHYVTKNGSAQILFLLEV